MNKCSIISIFACLMSFDSFANVYTGVNLGINTVTIKKNLLYPLDVDDTLKSSHFNNAYTNFHGQFLVGYELPVLTKFSTSFEANADVFTGKSRYTINHWYINDNVSAEEQLEYGFAFFVLPTYKYNESVRFFAGPGVSGSRFSIKAHNTAGNVGVSVNDNTWLTGVGLKMGSATKLTNTMDLVLTYQFMQYGRVTRTHIEPITDDTLQGNYKPNVNAVLVGLRVHFPDVITK